MINVLHVFPLETHRLHGKQTQVRSLVKSVSMGKIKANSLGLCDWGYDWIAQYKYFLTNFKFRMKPVTANVLFDVQHNKMPIQSNLDKISIYFYIHNAASTKDCDTMTMPSWIDLKLCIYIVLLQHWEGKVRIGETQKYDRRRAETRA